MSDAPKFDLATSDGGRGYLAHLFKTHLNRHDFTRYISVDLAADFACVMSRFVHTVLERETALQEALTIAQQCNAELEKELGPTIEQSRATNKAVAAALAPGEGRCKFDVLWKSGSSAIDATITQEQYTQILRIISPETSGISEGFRAAVASPESSGCKACGGTRLVDDGELHGSAGGVPYENGPIKCVKDCPDCSSERLGAEVVALTAVATLRDDGDGGLEPDWLLEGGTAELFEGMVLLVADQDQTLCEEDGHVELYRRPAAVGADS